MGKPKIAVRYYIQFTVFYKNRPNGEDLNPVEKSTKFFLENRY